MTEEWEHDQLVLPFDLWEEEKGRTEEKIRIQTENLKKFEVPKTDNEKLLNLQFDYRHGDKEALGKIYKHSVEVCLKFINAVGKKNAHVRELSDCEKESKAADAASYLVEQFLTRPDFAINKNIPGYLYLRVEHELFYKRKVDGIVDFVDLNEFFKEGEEDENTCFLDG